MQTTMSKQAFVGAAIGTMIEYYDLVLFAIFLPIISPLFFPAQSVYQSLVKGYFVLLIAMAVRPLGGLLFGYLGDVFGRRRALLGSMYGIALATILMGIVPTHAMIGVWAAVIIVLAKSIQMLCFGGEYNGAGIYVVEHAQSNNEGFIGSLLTATTLFGALMASLVGVLCTLKGMPVWSWRVAFLIGGIVGVFGILYRKNLLEAPNFKRADLKLHSFKNMIKKYPQELTAGVMVGGFATVPFTTALTFINPILMVKGHINSHELMLLQSLLILMAILAIVVAGRVADKISPNKVMQFGAVLLVLVAYPLMLLVDEKSLPLLILAQALLIIVNEILLGPSNAYLKSLFAMEYRYRASSFSFCLGMSIIGGITPLAENFLYRLTGEFSAVAIWLIVIGIGTLISMKLVDKKRSLQTLLPGVYQPWV